jgi:hypothetical protein
LLMADLLWEKSTAGWWLISQANRVGIGNRWRWWRERVQLMYCVEDIWCDLIWRVHAWICFAASKTSTDPFIVLQLFVLFFFKKKTKIWKVSSSGVWSLWASLGLLGVPGVFIC